MAVANAVKWFISMIRFVWTIGRYLFMLVRVANPVGLAITAISVAVMGLYYAWKNNLFGIQGIVFTVLERIKTKFEQFKTFLTVTVPQAFIDFKQAAAAKWTVVKTWFIAVAAMLVTIFTNLPGLLYTVGSKFISKLKQGGASKWEAAKAWFSAVSRGVVATFLALPGMFFEVGSNIISAIKQGASSRWESTKTWFSGAGNWIVTNFKGIFGIKSPSTVFKSLGQFIMEGLKIGLEDGWVGVAEKLGGYWDNIKNGAVDAWQNFTGGGDGTTGGGMRGSTGTYNPGKSGKKLGLDGVNPQTNNIVQSAVSGLSATWTESIAGFCSRWVRQVMGNATGGKTNRLFGSSAKASEKLWQAAGMSHSLASLGGAKGLKPGDVLFQGFGSGGYGHVGIYLGNGKVAENSTRYGGKGDARGVTDLASFGTITSVGRYPSINGTKSNAPQPRTLDDPKIKAARQQMYALAQNKASEGGNSITQGERSRIEAYLKALVEKPGDTTLKVDSKTLAKVVKGQQQQNARTGGARPATRGGGIRR